jgi:hypothetical protein
MWRNLFLSNRKTGIIVVIKNTDSAVRATGSRKGKKEGKTTRIKQ